jgi:hypothetical protein
MFFLASLNSELRFKLYIKGTTAFSPHDCKIRIKYLNFKGSPTLNIGEMPILIPEWNKSAQQSGGNTLQNIRKFFW